MPLYAFGSNGSGQLGIGHNNDTSQPQLVLSSSQWQVKQLAAGGNHTVILCADGQVRASGNVKDAGLGVDSKSTDRFSELPLHDPEHGGRRVRQVACTWSATILLCNDGTLHTCGTGSSGELGLGPQITKASTLCRISDFPPANTQVVHIAACMAHVVAVLSNGEVYAWGKGRKGQLGEPAVDVWSPRRIEGLDFHATNAICGKDFTVVLGAKPYREMAIFGPNRGDRFGVRTSAPASPSSWDHAAASWGGIYGVEASGRVEAWGRDDHGQLPSSGLPEIENLAAGSEHAIALTKTGKVLAWGWGEHGNCGEPTDERGDVLERWVEVAVPGTATAVFAGCATSFIQTIH